MKWQQKISPFLLSFFLFAMPASTTYEMRDYSFGSGAVGNAESTTYGMNAVTGELSGAEMESSSFSLNPGLMFVQQAAVPPSPTLVNDGNFYNKLKLTLDNSNNPTDTLFAVAISNDNWVTTNYVQSDNTVGASLGSEDYQTYADWGGASGEYIIGLTPDSAYAVKVKAIQGKFTETDFGPEDTANTSAISLTYDLDVSAIDEETGSPYQVTFNTLTPGTVTTAADKVWVDVDTNAIEGAFVYAYASSAGLQSTNAGHTISAMTGNLAGASEGFGIRSDAVSEDTGGPLVAVSPYDGSSDVVGTLDTTTRTLFTTSGEPISNGRAALLVKAKASSVTPAATDYTTILTIVASATF